MISVRILRDTYFKRKTADASELTGEEKAFVAAGAVLELETWAEIENHLFVEFKSERIYDRSVWFVWAADAEILKDGQPKVLVSDTKIYQFMALLDRLSEAIADVNIFLKEQMKYKSKG